MYRRRRRRNSFQRPPPVWLRPALIGAGGAIFIALFVFFIRQSDTLAPEPQTISVELPDAFKE